MYSFNSYSDLIGSKRQLQKAVDEICESTRMLKAHDGSGVPCSLMNRFASALQTLELLPLTLGLEADQSDRIEEALETLRRSRIIWKVFPCEMHALIERFGRNDARNLHAGEYTTTGFQLYESNVLIRCHADAVGSPEASEMLRGVRAVLADRRYSEVVIDMEPAKRVGDDAIAPLYLAGAECENRSARIIFVAQAKIQKQIARRSPEPLAMVDSLVECMELIHMRQNARRAREARNP